MKKREDSAAEAAAVVSADAAVVASEISAEERAEAVGVKRVAGRPAGAKNKPKPVVLPAEAVAEPVAVQSSPEDLERVRTLLRYAGEAAVDLPGRLCSGLLPPEDVGLPADHWRLTPEESERARLALGEVLSHAAGRISPMQAAVVGLLATIGFPLLSRYQVYRDRAYSPDRVAEEVASVGN